MRSLVPLVVLACLAVAFPLSAQQAPAAGDTVQSADSTRARIFRELEALGRPPGADSARLARDSVELARRTGGGREAAGAADAGVGAQDSVAGALRELQGYFVTGYSGTSAEFEAGDRQLILRGSADERPRVARQGMTLAADSAIVYDETGERVRAVGAAEYTPETGDAVASRTMVLDLTTQRGSALGARTRYAQGGTDWIVTGDLPSVDSELVYGSHTSFTSCDLEEPHYHFESDEIKIHQGNILVARPVRLYFADVPVAWLPFIAQSLSQGRASGLLTPRFSVNDIVRTSSGYSRRISNIGFYWAMSQYSDATLAMDWFSDQFTSLTGSVRYSWARQFLNGNLGYREFWRANGSRERAFNTRHSWEISERTRFSMDARYVSSSQFLQENSFDPREVTQSIRSEGGLSHRFDWGSLNLGANRKQYLTDDRTEMTLPTASLSLSPITFFQASPSQAAFYNNVTWTGRASFSRRLRIFEEDQPLDEDFDVSRADQATMEASGSSGFSLGNFSLSQSASYGATDQRGIPDFLLSPDPGEDVVVEDAVPVDLKREELSWNVGASYQQRLIGSTTLTPRINVSSRAVRSDTSSVRSGFIPAPFRTSFGARLKTDIFGFYPGVGSFERIRHKISPGVSYDYSPEVVPTSLQRRVFGSGEIQKRSVVSLSLNQTIEAKLTPEAEEEVVAEEARRDSIAQARADSLAAEDGVDGATPDDPFAEDDADDLLGDPAGPQGTGDATVEGLPDDGLERLETGRAVMLLGLQTSVVTYDLVQADSAGNFLGGFQTTTLNNSLRSDYLRGLNLQFTHDLFEDQPGTGTGGGGSGPPARRFAPHLSSMNFGFALDSSSSLFRWLGLFGPPDGADATGSPDVEGAGPPPGSADEGPDESSIVPGDSPQAGASPGGGRGGGVGQWDANFSYSLQRPRRETATGSQMLQMSFNVALTEHWDGSWSTAYDINEGAFADHVVRLTRDLHRWRANFDFLQTSTGNWSFRFSVSLLDNQDLEFDYEQRSPLPQR